MVCCGFSAEIHRQKRERWPGQFIKDQSSRLRGLDERLGGAEWMGGP